MKSDYLRGNKFRIMQISSPGIIMFIFFRSYSFFCLTNSLLIFLNSSYISLDFFLPLLSNLFFDWAELIYDWIAACWLAFDIIPPLKFTIYKIHSIEIPLSTRWKLKLMLPYISILTLIHHFHTTVSLNKRLFGTSRVIPNHHLLSPLEKHLPKHV